MKIHGRVDPHPQVWRRFCATEQAHQLRCESSPQEPSQYLYARRATSAPTDDRHWCRGHHSYAATGCARFIPSPGREHPSDLLQA